MGRCSELLCGHFPPTNQIIAHIHTVKVVENAARERPETRSQTIWFIFQDKSPIVLKWPKQSPDLNCTEHLCRDLKIQSGGSGRLWDEDCVKLLKSCRRQNQDASELESFGKW